MTRGIVVVPGMCVGGRTIYSGDLAGSTPFRQYALYWDKIDWPHNNIWDFVHGLDGPDCRYLAAAGVLTRTNVEFEGTVNAQEILPLTQLAALDMHNKCEPGQWSMAQHGLTLISPTETTVPGRAIEVELYGLLPVPTDDVPMDRVLEFRHRRYDELLALRDELDVFYLEIANNVDFARAKLQAETRIRRVLRDLHTAFNETFARRLLTSWKVELNVTRMLMDGGFLAGVGMTANASPVVVAALGIAGAAAGTLTVGAVHLRRGENIPESLRPFAYLVHVEKELRKRK